jgi:CRP-like cAMP-binding protein
MINLFKKTYTKDETKLFDFLKETKYFGKLTEEELANIAPHMYLRNYKENEVVFFRDDPSHALYLVKKGMVALTFDIKNEFINLRSVKRGHVFGDNSLLENTKRIYNSVVESEEAELYVIPQINLLQIFGENPTIKAKVMTAFAEVYNAYNINLFNSYRTSFGFFDLRMVYSQKSEE